MTYTDGMAYIHIYRVCIYVYETQKKTSSWMVLTMIDPEDPNPLGTVEFKELAQTRRHPMDPPNILWIHLEGSSGEFLTSKQPSSIYIA